MEISFEISEEIAAEAEEILSRKASYPDMNTLFKEEALLMLGLTDIDIRQKKIGQLVEKLKDIELSKFAEIDDILKDGKESTEP